VSTPEIPAERERKEWPGRLKEWHAGTKEPGLTALLVIESLLIFLVIPLTAMGAVPQITLELAFATLVIAILVVTWRSHTATTVVLIAVILSAIGSFLWREDPNPSTEWLSAGGRVLALAAMSFVIARVVFRSGRVTFHRVQGAILLYLNIALMFFIFYRLLSFTVPHSFANLPDNGNEFGSGATLLYFSFTTLTTLGYGDIIPVHPLARSLTGLEAVVGQLYPATLLARLVSLQLQHRNE
jgi:Ion channel